jgi:hypothetical protein
MEVEVRPASMLNLRQRCTTAGPREKESTVPLVRIDIQEGRPPEVIEA